MQSSTLSTFATADFSGSGVCAFCHRNLQDNANQDVSIDSHWRSTMMANGGISPTGLSYGALKGRQHRPDCGVKPGLLHGGDPQYCR